MSEEIIDDIPKESYKEIREALAYLQNLKKNSTQGQWRVPGHTRLVVARKKYKSGEIYEAGVFDTTHISGTHPNEYDAPLIVALHGIIDDVISVMKCGLGKYSDIVEFEHAHELALSILRTKNG